MKVFAYEPDVVYVEPDHVNVLQADSVVEPVLLYLIVKCNVSVFRQLTAFVFVFVYKPLVVNVLPNHTYELHVVIVVEDVVLWLIVRSNV